MNLELSSLIKMSSEELTIRLDSIEKALELVGELTIGYMDGGINIYGGNARFNVNGYAGRGNKIFNNALKDLRATRVGD